MTVTDLNSLRQLFETEITRKIKREPALAVEPNMKVFAAGTDGNAEEPDGDVVMGSGQRDFINELWVF